MDTWKVVRVSPEIHTKLKVLAARRGHSISKVVEGLLAVEQVPPGWPPEDGAQGDGQPGNGSASPPRSGASTVAVHVGGGGDSTPATPTAVPLDCLHPRSKVVPSQAGGFLVCGLCGEEVSYD